MSEKPEHTDELLARWLKNPIFAAAGERRCRELAATCASRRYAAGELLLEQGELADHVYVVLDGAVRIYQRAADGREVLVKLMRAPCLSQQQIALSLGAVRRSVAKVLGDWTNKGLVSRRGEHHLIHRIAELEALAEPIRGSLNFQIGMPLDQLGRREVLDQGVVEVEAHGRRLIVGDELIVGARGGCHLVLQDVQVADRHCRIYRGATGPRFWVEDLQSEHGTRLNGATVNRAVLRDGDTLEVGATTLRFALERKAAAEP